MRAGRGKVESVIIHGVIDANGQTPFKREPLHQPHFCSTYGHIVQARPAARGIDFGPSQQHGNLLGLAGLGHERRKQTHGGVDQQSIRRARLVLLDPSPFRIGCLRGDTRGIQRRPIGQQRMAIGAGENDRMIRRNRVNIRGDWHAALRPARLNPAPTDQDAARFQPLKFRFNAGDQFRH